MVVCSGGMEAQLQPFFHGNFPVLIRPTSRLETLHGKEVGAVMNAVTVGTLTIIISRQTHRYFQPNYIYNNNNNIYSGNPLALVVFSGALQFYTIHLSQSSAKPSLCNREAYYFWNRCGNLFGGESINAFVSRDASHSRAPGSSHRH